MLAPGRSRLKSQLGLGGQGWDLHRTPCWSPLTVLVLSQDAGRRESAARTSAVGSAPGLSDRWRLRVRQSPECVSIERPRVQGLGLARLGDLGVASTLTSSFPSALQRP